MTKRFSRVDPPIWPPQCCTGYTSAVDPDPPIWPPQCCTGYTSAVDPDQNFFRSLDPDTHLSNMSDLHHICKISEYL